MKNRLSVATDEFSSLLRQRFNLRNDRFRAGLTNKKGELNARGLLHSSMTVAATHEMLNAEFEVSARVIATTAIEVISMNRLLRKEGEFQVLCSAALGARRGELEALFLEDMAPITEALQNKSMIEPYLSLSGRHVLQSGELAVCFAGLHEKYVKDRGGNLAGMMKNTFLDHPIGATLGILGGLVGVVAGS